MQDDTHDDHDDLVFVPHILSTSTETSSLWYGTNGDSNRLIMIEANEVERLHKEIRHLRELYIQLQTNLKELTLDYNKGFARFALVESTFKEQLSIELQKAAKQQQELRTMIAQKEQEHLQQIQEFRDTIEELKRDYEIQIQQMKQRPDDVAQQRIENRLIRTHKPFPVSLFKRDAHAQASSLTTAAVVAATAPQGSSSSVSRMTSAISSMLNISP